MKIEHVCDLRPGDRVKATVHGGINLDGTCDRKQVSGRAVIINAYPNPQDCSAVINIGGRYGTPVVVTPETFVSATRRA